MMLGLRLGLGAGKASFGSELLANGDFATGDLTGWDDVNAFWTVSGGKAVHASSSVFNQLRQAVSVTAGWSCRLAFTISNYSGTGGVRVQWRNAGGSPISPSIYGSGGAFSAITADGTYIETITVPATANYLMFARDASGNSAAFELDNVSLRRAL